MKVAPGSLAENANVAERRGGSSAGGVCVIVTVGAVVSGGGTIVQRAVAGRSRSRRGPRARTAKSCCSQREPPGAFAEYVQAP